MKNKVKKKEKYKKKLKKKFKKKFKLLENKLLESSKDLELHYKNLIELADNQNVEKSSTSKARTKPKKTEKIKLDAKAKLKPKTKPKPKKRSPKVSKKLIKKRPAKIIPIIPKKYLNLKNITYVKGEDILKARVMRHNKSHQRNFSFVAHGSWKKTAENAQEWIKDMLEKLPDKIKTSDRPVSTNSKSGITGVHKGKTGSKTRGKQYVFYRWFGSWTENGKVQRLGWSIDTNITISPGNVVKFNERKCFILACASRYYKEKNKEKVINLLPEYRKTQHYRLACKAYKKISH